MALEARYLTESPTVEEMEARYAEWLGVRNDTRRRAMAELARRYAVDRVLLFKKWIARYAACLDAHSRLEDVRKTVFVIHLKRRLGIRLSMSERLCRSRAERRLLRRGFKVAQMYEEFYRDVVLFAGRTERDTPARGFFDELTTLVWDSKQMLETPAAERHTDSMSALYDDLVGDILRRLEEDPS